MKNPDRKADKRRAAAGIDVRNDTLIIVNSRHGSTLQYAEWISNALDTDMIPFSKRHLGYAALYRNVIYMGWIRSGEIVGLSLLQQNYENFHMGGKHIIVAAVGIGDATEEYRKRIYRENYLGRFADSFYLLTGRFDPDHMRPSDVGALNSFIKNVQSVYSEAEGRQIMDRLQEGYNGIDMAAVQPIVAEIKELRI